MKSIQFKFLPALMVLLMLSVASASAQRNYEVNCSNLRLSEVLKEVTRETGYNFVYNNTSVDVSQTVTVNVSSPDINVILEAVFEGTGIAWTLMDKQIALRQEAVPQKPSTDIRQDVRVVRGQVLDDLGQPLAGAEFQLTKTDGGKTHYATASGTEGNYKITGWTETAGDATKFVSPASGNIAVDGLKDGTYQLTETKAPAGYNLLADPIVVVIASDGKVTVGGQEANQIKVENMSGNELPSTGGIGTTIFYTMGGLLAVGAAVLLVTKKRVHDAEA